MRTRIGSGVDGGEHQTSPVSCHQAASQPKLMAARARMLRRWADSMPGPAAGACRRRACELMLMAEVAAAAG